MYKHESPTRLDGQDKPGTPTTMWNRCVLWPAIHACMSHWCFACGEKRRWKMMPKKRKEDKPSGAAFVSFEGRPAVAAK
jgi:hypothetical protein